jgi:hypothetical protein
VIPLLIWRESVVLRRPAVRRYLDGCGLPGAPSVLAEWGFGGGSEGAAKPEPAPAAGDAAIERVPKNKIHQAITAAYDAAATAGEKPPNVNEIVGPVQVQLRATGYEASGRQIRELAGADQHKSRRRKTGKTVASEKRQQGR